VITYSRWEPSGGYYDYFEADERPGINDDLPVPSLPPATEIGVPSTECGRPLPAGAVHVGAGEWAVGLMAFPAGVEQLGATNGTLGQNGWFKLAAAGAVGVGVGLLIGRWRP
jgi:hypothetical protein